MNRPLSIAYWDGLRRLAEPFELMKFTLIYDGDLPAGDSSRATYAGIIRNAFHDQLADLWKRDIILRTLAHTARTPAHQYFGYFGGTVEYAPPGLPSYPDPPPPVAPGQVDYCAPITIKDVGAFIPLVRESLFLACSLDILFLRHDDDFRVLQRGGDLDNRTKTLFDALRMPKSPSELGGTTPVADPLYVVAQDDAWIHGLSIKTGTLLGGDPNKHHQVRLTVDVIVTVMRVFPQNLCLVGG